MRILVDTNIFLDVALDRKQFADESAGLLSVSGIQLFSAWHTVSNLWYIVRKENSFEIARDAVWNVLKTTIVPRGGSLELFHAFRLGISDFEDAMQAAIADSYDIDYIATRNISDFENSPVEARTPGDLLSLLL